MKCLYLTPGVFDKGGISRYGRFHIQALRDVLGHESVRALSLLGPAGSPQDLEPMFEVDWHSGAAAATAAVKLGFVRLALATAGDFRPNVIWSAHINFAGLARFLARRAGALSIVQVYGLEVWTPRRFRPDIGWGVRRCDRVVSDCHFTADYVAEHLRPGDRPAVMWDCVDIERFRPGELSRALLDRYGLPDPSRHPMILTLGRLARDAAYKGYERLLAVLPQLPESVHLVVAGGGNLVPSLKEQASTLGVGDRVHFTGFVDDGDLPGLYRAAHAFCLIGDRGPGRGEGIPLTPLEAAACGVPILVGNQDGSREAVEHGVTGFALDPFDLEGIGTCLTNLLSDESRRRKMSVAGRRRMEREHSYERFRERVRDFLAQFDSAPVSEG